VREDIEGREKYRRGLSALSHLCVQPDLFETLVVRLSVRLSFLYAPTTAPEDPEPSAAYAHALLSTLADVLARKVEGGDLDVPKYVDRLVPRLFNLAAYGVLAAPGSAGVTDVADPRVIGVSARLVNLVVQSLSAQLSPPVDHDLRTLPDSAGVGSRRRSRRHFSLLISRARSHLLLLAT
jgi:DNA repair/transcription protein MET18/MMS19